MIRIKGMDLSVIIASYNTRELLGRCLKSVEREKGKLALEAIVIDNASTDSSPQMVKKEFPKVKLTVNRENLGFARAVNQGFREAQGKTILLLNSDTQLTKGGLAKLLEFEKKVGPAIIGTKLINPDGSVQPSVFYLPTVKRAILEYWLGRKGYFAKYAPTGENPQEVEVVSGGAMLISRAVAEKIGLMDERYFMYFEDLDFCRRAHQAGFKVYYLPTVEIIHEHGASGKALVDSANQWRRLVPSSKIYHGDARHYLINFILWSGQKLKDFLS
jgi:hypothetical protein